MLPLIFKTNLLQKYIITCTHVIDILLNFIARDVCGVHENMYNLNTLLLKLKYAFRKICIDDTKINSLSLHTAINYPSNNTEDF